MLDLRANSIEYQAQRELVSQTEALVLQRRNGKYSKSKWRNLIEAARYLDIVGLKDKLDSEDLSQLTYIYECLISKLEIDTLPANPGVSIITIPQVIAGVPGPQGEAGAQGEKGDTGGGKDFDAGSISITTTVDSFNVAEAYGARWDYLVNGTAQRVGTILATWTEDGAAVSFNDYSTADANGSTAGIEFSVSYTSSTISLVATITSGTWAVSGTRYWIPNTGNYTPPVSSVLSTGYMFIGNNLNVAQQRLLAGDVTVSTTGTTTISAGAVTNTKIAAAAGISLNKLAAVTPTLALVSDGDGFITTLAGITPTKLGYLVDVSSNIQAQLNGKQATITGAATTVVSDNLTPGFVVVSDGTTGKIVVSGTSTSKLAFLNGVTSDIQAQLDTKVSAGAGTFTDVVIDIGDWNMDSTGGITITLPGITPDRIRGARGIIRSDPNFAFTGLVHYFAFGSELSSDVGGNVQTAPAGFGNMYQSGSDTAIILRRTQGGIFDATEFNATGYNRGWVTITYIA